jgi:hypothetical protein
MKSKKYRTFTVALEKILSVTPTEIKQRETREKANRKYTGKKRGPKPSASDRALADKD